MGDENTQQGLTIEDAQDLIRVQVENLREVARDYMALPEEDQPERLAQAAHRAYRRFRDLEYRACHEDAEPLFGQAATFVWLITRARGILEHAEEEAQTRETWNALLSLVDVVDQIAYKGELLLGRPEVR